MRTKTSVIILFLLTFSKGHSQEREQEQECFKRLIDLLRENRTSELASLISYPLVRLNPLPNIDSKDQFIQYYPVLFDSAFKTKLTHSDTSDIWQRYDNYTIFNGDIWINSNCRIIRINYSSERERQLQDSLTEIIRKTIHPSVAQWQRNIFVLDARKFIVRLDLTDKGFRYASWRKGHTISEKPDLVLYNGSQEFQGTEGGVTYTFTKGGWQYVIDQIDMCRNPEQCGIFLVISRDGQEKDRLKCLTLK